MCLLDVVRLLKQERWTLATAESCTGGLLAKRLTDIPGSSEYFLDGIVAYADQAKVRLLGVSAALLARYGAVSVEVAGAMARQCRENSGSDYAVSTTGIAGPGGATPQKPIGLVYLGLAGPNDYRVHECRLNPALSREQIRGQAVAAALQQLFRYLEDHRPAGP